MLLSSSLIDPKVTLIIPVAIGGEAVIGAPAGVVGAGGGGVIDDGDELPVGAAFVVVGGGLDDRGLADGVAEPVGVVGVGGGCVVGGGGVIAATMRVTRIDPLSGDRYAISPFGLST